MKTSKTYRVIACILAVLMFSTSAGFAIDVHYCGGQLKSVNIFGKAKTCGEKSRTCKAKDCQYRQHKHQHSAAADGADQLQTNGCCNNKMIQVHSDQDQAVPTLDFKLNQPLQQFITAFVFTFVAQPVEERALPNFEQYRPPLILRDIPVLTQSFLL